jgi:1-phosphofructokinase family hexose kinase
MISICLNPAWQKTLLFEDVALGMVNRAQALHECGGGKGVNLARALRLAGERPQLALFAGGTTGDKLLAELDQTGIAAVVVQTEAQTRTCTTIVNQLSGQVTELIEPSGEITGKELRAMRQRLHAAVRKASGIAVCGTLPPGVPEELYGDIVRDGRAAGVPVLVDGYRGVRPALEAGPTVLKINADELRHLCGRANLEDAAFDCLTLYAVEMLAITDGPRPAFLFTRHDSWQFDQPTLKIRNAIGAGDCASAILLRELVAQTPPAEAFRRALAAANASCLTDTPSQFQPEDAQVLGEQIRAEKL